MARAPGVGERRRGPSTGDFREAAVLESTQGLLSVGPVAATTDEILAGLTRSIEAGRSAGLAAPAPPAAPDLAGVRFAMPHRATHECSTTPVDPEAEARLVETLAVVVHRAIGPR